MRPSKDAYFLGMAQMASTRSTCLRQQHGAVLVRSGAVLSTGYNGACCGLPSCDETGTCKRIEAGALPGERYELCVAVHAEANAIIQAARHGASTEGATLYITGQPCLMCARAIVNAGIAEVVFQVSERYTSEESIGLLGAAGVKVREL